MEDFTKPVHPPTPQPIKRNIDGFVPVRNRSVNPNNITKNDVLNKPVSPISFPKPDIVKPPAASQGVVPVAVDQPKTEVKSSELIPGLNTKPNESSFDQVGLEDLTNSEAPVKEQKEVPNVLSAPEKPVKKSKFAAIFVAILVALALIGGAGYAYWQKRQEATKTTNTPAKVEEKATTTHTTPGAKANAAIDEALKKLDDTKEFQESDLSDTTLGLQ